jgi:hypothetical protein
MRRLALIAVLGCGCGAGTLRFEIAPTVDTEGHVGVEGGVHVGAGVPLDVGHRAHHYLQAFGGGGGGVALGDGGTGLVRAELDYLLWLEPRLDLRVGSGYAWRDGAHAAGDLPANAVSGHVAALPVLAQAPDANVTVRHFALGPAFRGEAVFLPGGRRIGRFALPITVEMTLLVAGD